jgi:hypothetical protein
MIIQVCVYWHSLFWRWHLVNCFLRLVWNHDIPESTRITGMSAQLAPKSF